jgi:hypothetical protein
MADDRPIVDLVGDRRQRLAVLGLGGLMVEALRNGRFRLAHLPPWHQHRSGLGVYRRAGVVFFWAQRTIEKAAGICALRLARFENGLSMKSIPASAVGGGASGASVGRNVADRQRLAAVLDGGGEFDPVMMASLRPGGVSRASRATVPDGLAD